MYHPRYNFPIGGQSVEQRVMPHSDAYHLGTYTYMLSAFNRQGYHDTRKVRLRIVEGEVFKITKFTGPSTTNDTAKAGVSKLRLEWQTAQSLYGADSKVRILLSKDFGKTFPYVLADYEDNDGIWEGICPYIEVGRTPWEFSSMTRNIRGAVIKIEVIGEVAYALSHEKPYWISGSNVVGTGGFLITTDSREIAFDNTPEISATYAKRSQIPPMQNLVARLGGKSIQVQGTEQVQGNSLLRKWVATINDKTATFTQVLSFKDGDAGKTIPPQVNDLAERAGILYRNLGNLGYPKREATQAQHFIEAYQAVYDSDGRPRVQVNQREAEALQNAFDALSQISDSDIVMPIPGAKYKIANYHRIFEQEQLYYLVVNPGSREETSSDSNNASVWICRKEGELYQFSSEDNELNLNGSNVGGAGYTLMRGYTWGSFSIVGGWQNSSRPRLAYYNGIPQGLFTEVTEPQKINDYKVNKGGSISSDFRFILVGEAPDITPPQPPQPPQIQTYAVTLRQSEGGTISASGYDDLSRVPHGTNLSISAQPSRTYR